LVSVVAYGLGRACADGCFKFPARQVSIVFWSWACFARLVAEFLYWWLGGGGVGSVLIVRVGARVLCLYMSTGARGLFLYSVAAGLTVCILGSVGGRWGT